MLTLNLYTGPKLSATDLLVHAGKNPRFLKSENSDPNLLVSVDSFREIKSGLIRKIWHKMRATTVPWTLFP